MLTVVRAVAYMLTAAHTTAKKSTQQFCSIAVHHDTSNQKSREDGQAGLPTGCKELPVEAASCRQVWAASRCSCV